ncbi:MAG: tRNA (adenine-N1)-methyltransferase [Sulfolobaceae archaeon]|jgi:tRNA (adenine57-N1/adenine58-N1)-methyltransferase|uniref:tRNA (adenine-N1)-methyltransferase n=1 Tax=Stygiolobus sp. CP850M TaxID=3133134 RepID=UPI000D582DD2|nr:protein methyltransferase [Sulfolobus sp. SCGC AB-777_G06]
MPLKEGDSVVIWVDPKRVFLVKVEKGKKFGSDKGTLDLSTLIGKEYGSTVSLSTGVQAYLLRPTPLDAYNGLRRPSQVLYPKDISYMIYVSGIKEGDTVIEAGTGSGFLTISLAYTVGEKGRVITYDIREDMQETARRNLSFMGLLDRVTFKLKDIRQGIDERDVDAVFLDMPDPWNTIQYVHEILKPSGSVVIFVPTVNQIEKTVLKIREFDFVDVHAEELIVREYQVKENATRPKNIGVVHTGFIIRARKSIKGG